MKFLRRYWLLVLIVLVIVVFAPFVMVGRLLINPSESQIYKAQDARRKTDFKILQSGIILYQKENNKYPQDLSLLKSTGQLQEIPMDPSGVSYEYKSKNEGEDFELCINLVYGGHICIDSKSAF